MGMADDKPIVMEVDPTDGTVRYFLSFKNEGDGDGVFKTANGVYHDVNDSFDGLAYYYVSFF